MALALIDAKFERKLTCAFQNDMRNLTNFCRLKNSNLILESKMAELNKKKTTTKNIEAARSTRCSEKLYFTLEMNE